MVLRVAFSLGMLASRFFSSTLETVSKRVIRVSERQDLLLENAIDELLGLLGGESRDVP